VKLSGKLHVPAVLPQEINAVVIEQGSERDAGNLWAFWRGQIRYCFDQLEEGISGLQGDFYAFQNIKILTHRGKLPNNFVTVRCQYQPKHRLSYYNNHNSVCVCPLKDSPIVNIHKRTGIESRLPHIIH
jgi:hypothetical protein